MISPWWREGLFFTCLACGRCCRGEPGAIFVTPEEEQALAAFHSIELEEFRRRFETGRWGSPSLREKERGECVFFSSPENRCSVYPLRPLQCRLFPFWPSILESPEEWEKTASECPGMNGGEWHSPEEIAELLSRNPFLDLL